MSSLKSSIHSTLSQTAVPLTKELRSAALKSGWPKEAVRSLSVHFNEGEFAIKYPDHVKGLVEDLEYGTEDTPPSAVIRQFSNRMDSHIHHIINGGSR
jgi:hypothetical protein